MKKITVLFLGLIVLIFLLVLRCSKNETPENFEKQLDEAIKNWNDLYGQKIKANGWTFKYTSTSENERKKIVEDITNPETAWFPSIDIANLDNITALLVKDDATISTDDIKAWQDQIDNIVLIGCNVIEISWTKGGNSFTTTCVTNNDNILYDNMLSNACGSGTSSLKTVTCCDIRMWWIWEEDDGWENWTRGYARGILTANCRDGVAVSCDKNCTASYTLGEAKITCKTTKELDCCIMECNWAWACGFKKVKIAYDGFTLEIEGHLGSSGSGSNSCTECCN